MHWNLLWIVTGIIAFVLLLIFALIFSLVVRRIINGCRFRVLDRERKIYRAKLLSDLRNEVPLQIIVNFSLSRRRIIRQAREDVLLDVVNTEPKYRENVKKILERLGYVSYYEGKLDGSLIESASAIDKLGKMRSNTSVEKLSKMLTIDNPEIISITMRSLARIGAIEGLVHILENLPNLLKKKLVSHKTLTTSFVRFGSGAIPILAEYAEKYKNPAILSIIFDVLSALNAKEALPLALEHLNNINPEVRAKALKIIGTTARYPDDIDGKKLLPMLDDEVWFVRLNAVRALGNIKYAKAIDFMGGLLLDDKWQVRNETAVALAKFGNASLDIFLKILKYEDAYAKGSICEEMQKSNFVSNLIENLESESRDIYEKSRAILKHMCSLHFTTPLVEYLKSDGKKNIRKEIENILQAQA